MNTKYEKIREEFAALIRKPVKDNGDREKIENLKLSLERESTIIQHDLLKDLKTVGINVSTVWNLVNTKARYPKAIPVLIKHLAMPYPEKIKEGIIRALSVRESKGKAGRPLIEEFYKIPVENSSLRWVIGNAMISAIDKDLVPDVIAIAKNKENGSSRDRFVFALGKMREEQTIIDLLDDEEMVVYAIEVLGILKSIKAKGKIEQFLYHPDRSIKKAAEKALKKIG